MAETRRDTSPPKALAARPAHGGLLSVRSFHTRIILAVSLTLYPLGAAEIQTPGHPEAQFGGILPHLTDLGVGSCMDAAISNGHLFVIGSGALHVFDISDPKAPKPAGRLDGLGRVRQIEISDDGSGIACITSREDGMFLVDVSRPVQPALLCHYDSIELATGIAISGKIAFIACRQAGVELVDITDPRNPVHLSTVHTGEAQSIKARDGFLYCGVWGSRELVVCDIRNPREPVITSRLPLDGYGDGVEIRGDYCFVATGHHSRAIPRGDEGDPGYGRGHGLEVFDLSADPAEPRFVSRIKTPPFYAIGMDMWSVTVSGNGNHAFFADTHNGMFVIDIRDPEALKFVAHRQLPFVENREAFSPVGGFAIGDGVVYVAGAWSDLHVLDAPGLAATPSPEADAAPAIGPRPPAKPDPRFRSYRPNGQVHGVAMAGDTALVAAGMAGLHAVRLFPEIEKLAEYPTEGFAMDVAVRGKLVFVSEGSGGLSIWQWDRESDGKLALNPVGRYIVKGVPVKQVEVPAPGRFALLQAGSNRLHILDVSNPIRPKKVLEASHPGLLYYHPIAEGLLEDRYASCFWHVSGFHWFDLTGPEAPRFVGDRWGYRTGSRNGMAHLPNRYALATYRNGYLLLQRGETRSQVNIHLHEIEGVSVTGKPTVSGTRLFCADRYGGSVIAVDINDVKQPKLIAKLQLREHPSPVAVHRGVPLIPGGHDGLIVWDELKQE